MEPTVVDGWNVAHLNGGLLLSADDFLVQFSTQQVDHFIELLNGGGEGQLRDTNGHVVNVMHQHDAVVLARVGDKAYPRGIVLPHSVFADIEADDAPIIEGVRPKFRRVNGRIKCGYRVTSGNKSAVVKPKTMHSAAPKVKHTVHAKRKKLVRALVSINRQNSAGLKLKRLNHPDS